MSTVEQNGKINHRIRDIIIATGISSVATQLLTIREFLSQSNGNEFVIALILFNWLLVFFYTTLFYTLVSIVPYCLLLCFALPFAADTPEW